MYGITIARCMVNNSQMYGKTIARCMVNISQMYCKTWPVNTCIFLASTIVAAICSEVSVCMQQDTLLHPREQKTSALTRLLGCASWFEPSLFECNKMKFSWYNVHVQDPHCCILNNFLASNSICFPQFYN